MAFRDINAQAPTHFLVNPTVRDGLTRLSNATEKHKAVLGHCMWAAAHVAKEQGLATVSYTHLTLPTKRIV